MTIGKPHTMESLFGLFGAIINFILVFIAASLTPGYDPRINFISDLGYSTYKSLFSIAFVIAGSLGIPFFINLERELVNIREPIRRLATAASIITSLCIALVGIIPDETYHEVFLLFHQFVAGFAFIGTCLYISLYSYLMYQGPRSKLYNGPVFKRILAYYGFTLNVPLVLFIITNSTIIEWILYLLTLTWLILTAITLLKYKFFNIPGIYYSKKRYPDALERFQEALNILKRLNLEDDPIAQTLQENVDYLTEKLEKE